MNCPDCGKVYRKVTELDDVRSVGLALKGTCVNCGTRFGVNSLWRKTKVIKPAPSPDAQRKRRYRENHKLET